MTLDGRKTSWIPSIWVRKRGVLRRYDKNDFSLAEMHLVYLNTKESSASLESVSGCKTLHVTLMVLSIYSLLGNYAEKTTEGYFGAIMAVRI